MTNTDTATGSENKNEVAEALSHRLDDWKAKIDEFLVQVDLAKLAVRDEATKKLDLAENAYLAAESSLRTARQDATVTAQGLRQGVEKLIHDLEDALKAAGAVIDRG